MQIQTTMRYRYICRRTAKNKKILHLGEDGEQLEFLHMAGNHVELYKCFKKWFGNF